MKSTKSHVVVRIQPGSDGDASHVPSDGKYTKVNPPTLYLEKAAQQWMESRGDARPGVKYILDSLPAGYTMWQRSRPNNATHVDKYLYGHPQGKKFDSPNRFYPHFQHLMDTAGSSFGCPCTVCAGSAGILPNGRSSISRSSNVSSATSKRSSSSKVAPAPIKQMSSQAISNKINSVPTKLPSQVTSSKAEPLQATATMALSTQPKGRPRMISTGADASRVDEEGTPDIYRNLIDKLRRYGSIDETIEESLSPDWHAEQNMLPKSLQVLRRQEQWIPRVGEMVLYLRELPEFADFIRHEETGEIQLYDDAADKLLGPPQWQAGLVGEAPSETTNLSALYTVNDMESIVNCGIRVEPLPDPNDKDKSLSKRHKYVPLRHVRPFVLWKELLHGIPQEDWHATIHHSLTVTSVLSLVGKFRFRGTWPLADIYCHGVYLGTELLAVGDTVRLLPNTRKEQSRTADILIIKSIRLKWSNMDKASDNDYDEGRPYNSEVWVYGAAYTSEASRSDKEWLSYENTISLKVGDDYSEWYPLHVATKELAVPFSRIIGRLYECAAVNAWLSRDADEAVDLDIGRKGLLEARKTAQEHDQRIVREPGATWYWGDTRADALDLHTLNGLDVSKYELKRDVRELRKQLKIVKDLEVDDMSTKSKRPAATTLQTRGLRRFMAPETTSLPIRASPSPGPGSIGETSSVSSRKVTHILDLSDDENDDEIRRCTKIVKQEPGIEGSKARVMVVID